MYSSHEIYESCRRVGGIHHIIDASKTRRTELLPILFVAFVAYELLDLDQKRLQLLRNGSCTERGGVAAFVEAG